jgi:hypothetical protein
MLHQTGQFHGINMILTHQQKQSLAVHCPACPEVGFNVNKDVMDNARESETYVIFRGWSYSILRLSIVKATNIPYFCQWMVTSVFKGKTRKAILMMLH